MRFSIFDKISSIRIFESFDILYFEVQFIFDLFETNVRQRGTRETPGGQGEKGGGGGRRGATGGDGGAYPALTRRKIK